MESTENDEKNWTKEEVLQLMDEKKRIESEMAEWTEVLNSQGGVGLHESLVDAEGISHLGRGTPPERFTGQSHHSENLSMISY